jgi:hypothetical protein
VFGIRSFFGSKCTALARSKTSNVCKGCIDNVLKIRVGCHEERASGNVHARISDSNLIWVTNWRGYIRDIMGSITLVSYNWLTEGISATSKTWMILVVG